MKRLYFFSIRSFTGPFLVTLFVSMFILILQFFWLYIDDLMGKGLGVMVILELLLYVSASLVPLALPLAILLSSLMTFGNFSENNELTAFKASGMSLYRVMRPLTSVVIGIALFTFYFANYVIPVANLKWHSMIFDIQNTKISSLLTPGVYTKDIEGYAIKIDEMRDSVNYGITIHDYSDNEQVRTIKAKEARIYKSENNNFLIFQLKNGELFEELDLQNPIFLPNGELKQYKKENRPSRVSSFSTGTFKIRMDGLSLARSDEKVFSDKHEMMNVFQIADVMDSLQQKTDQFSSNIAKSIISSHLTMTDDALIANNSENMKEISVPVKRFKELSELEKSNALNRTINFLRGNNRMIQNQLEFRKTFEAEQNRYWIEFHRKFSLTYTILVLFFIGAPLGAIVRKGGFGAPVVIAAIIFMIYFILISIGENLAETQTVSPFIGMWLASIFFTPIAVYITWVAANDRKVFNFSFSLTKLIKFRRIKS
ncbi:MAG: LptF/LptG family permease [Crocinitomicaceae bacterium]